MGMNMKMYGPISNKCLRLCWHGYVYKYLKLWLKLECIVYKNEFDYVWIDVTTLINELEYDYAWDQNEILEAENVRGYRVKMVKISLRSLYWESDT